ncbi:MAG: hypothetical protein R3264_22415, partial [Anaerolineae bacterium]|nr:hypothetical protein [Anaerolineae bacterium]
GIFEAVPLPAELQTCEWIDFRRNFKAGLESLFNLLVSPPKDGAAPSDPPPQTGRQIPKIVWASFGLSLITALLSVGAFWTIFLPYILLRLPYRILKRNFDFVRVQSALVMLPIALLMSALIVTNEDLGVTIFMLAFLSFLPALGLLLLLHLPGMQRWGKPIATRPRFANPLKYKSENTEPISFTVDFAPEDKKYAGAIIKSLEKRGHTHVELDQNPESALVLFSSYKNSTTLNPEKVKVYPVLIQQATGISQDLGRIQRIDFRRGLRNLDALARLLPEPVKLLQALAIPPPPGNQTVLPRIIQAYVYFLTLVAVFSMGGWLTHFYQLAADIIRESPLIPLGFFGIILIVFYGLIYRTIQSLIIRQGKLASLRNLILVILSLGILLFIQFLITTTSLDFGISESSDDPRGLAEPAIYLSYIVGLIIVGLMSLRYWSDLRRWFPHHQVRS